MDRPIKNRVNLTNGFTLTFVSVIGDIVLRYHRNSRCLILGLNCKYHHIFLATVSALRAWRVMASLWQVDLRIEDSHLIDSRHAWRT